MHDSLMSELTGGDKFKILLAQVLYPKPDVLFLDEPTNNLDLEAISWLEEQLIRHEGTMVVISHDRHFLNSVVTNILDVDFKKIREFTGNYDEWYMAANLIAKQQEMERDKKLKEKEELEAFVRRFSANASKAKQATSRQKRLEKLDIGSLLACGCRLQHRKEQARRLSCICRRTLRHDLLQVRRVGQRIERPHMGRRYHIQREGHESQLSLDGGSVRCRCKDCRSVPIGLVGALPQTHSTQRRRDWQHLVCSGLRKTRQKPFGWHVQHHL
jgi:ATPase subunit of ABC transporter with duplicated ATPase domains